MTHRNVLFASDAVVAAPISSRDEPQVENLWRRLDEQCRMEEGCAAVTIPHNVGVLLGTDVLSADWSARCVLERTVSNP